MAEYTPQEITDILCQKPDRITADFDIEPGEDARGWRQAIKRFFRSGVDNSILGPVWKAAGRSKEPEPKPDPDKSLRRAKTELCILGFSHDRIREITESFMRVIKDELHPSANIAAEQLDIDAAIIPGIQINTTYHLGLSIPGEDQSPLIIKVREILEERASETFKEALTILIAEDHSELLTVKGERAPGLRQNGLG